MIKQFRVLTQIRKAQIRILVLLCFMVLVMFFQNCSKKHETSKSNNSAFDGSVECGIEGYKFLHKNYFGRHCAVCHDDNGFAFPRFATNELSDAYMRIVSINPQTLIDSVENNKFCGEDCSLKRGQDLHYYFSEWMKCR